ncbi:MAG: transposase, partial [Candidatus Syntropharchaeia archaeon]
KRVATYVKAKVGFYCINGDSLIEFPEKNKAEDFTAFLRRIREANEKRIVVVLDNFRTHHARKVREEAEKLNISLVYLSPCSPDLNPIENVWKSWRKRLLKLSKREKFLGDKFKMLCNGP